MIRRPLVLDPAMLGATTFGLGLLRPAPGTWGSLPPVVLAWVMLASGWGPASVWLSMAAIAIVFGATTIAAGDRAEARWGKDPSSVVSDETSGQAVALMWLPGAAWGSGWGGFATVGLAFVLFRLFDIVKPPPAAQAQRIAGGWGILADDLVAAVFASASVHLIASWIW